MKPGPIQKHVKLHRSTRWKGNDKVEFVIKTMTPATFIHQ